MASTAANASQESFPAYEGRMHYIEGYVPSSLAAPHSSLERSSTWMGMGLVLTSLAGFGTLVFGLASLLWNPLQAGLFFTILGAVIAVVCLVGGFGLIHFGRRNYRRYVAETGRHV
ncbi:hypothetical protein GP475_01785 [Corynebacterium poyangense]|uniref:Uncharacterized protein n=1 Tax=Corynebacterium poyangense TaxID=2684405 RepID=A0A7H0SLS6_9CORY|nr:hypothetical protein [Corynebacterium poyangense]MBZ8177607.1 hypothetical protein [Corynebacterium poyangense]QNQ89501.1 hypothetical protein GP475_01785 [Corynebacterium poyangense]